MPKIKMEPDAIQRHTPVSGKSHDGEEAGASSLAAGKHG